MEARAEIISISYDENGNPIVAMKFPIQYTPQLKEFTDVLVSIKKYRKRRSLDANAYAWVLIDRLAEKTGISKIDIYREYIRNIGGVSTVACVETKNADKMIRTWESMGLGWQAEPFDSKIDGCTNIIFYQGSSVFDTKQMSHFIDQIVQDCKEQGIETDTPEEIRLRIERWKDIE